jgi:hypothetical protein
MPVGSAQIILFSAANLMRGNRDFGDGVTDIRIKPYSFEGEDG